MIDSQILVLIFITIIGWGLWAFFSKLGVQTIGKDQHLLVLEIIFFVGIIIYFGYNQKLNITPSKNLIYPVLAGLSTLAGSIVFYSVLEKTKVSWAISFTSLYPALTTILAIMILKEQLTFYQGLGIVFALISVFLLSL